MMTTSPKAPALPKEAVRRRVAPKTGSGHADGTVLPADELSCSGTDTPDSWSDVPRTFRRPSGALAEPWQAIFGPLRRGSVDDLVVVAQFGQSIDARIATAAGHSHYINGAAGLLHL